MAATALVWRGTCRTGLNGTLIYRILTDKTEAQRKISQQIILMDDVVVIHFAGHPNY